MCLVGMSIYYQLVSVNLQLFVGNLVQSIGIQALKFADSNAKSIKKMYQLKFLFTEHFS